MKTLVMAMIFFATVLAYSTSIIRGEYVSSRCESADGKVQVELIMNTENDNILLGFPTVGGYASYKAVESKSTNFKNGLKYTAKITAGNMSLDMEEYTFAKRNNRKAIFTSQAYGARTKKVAVKCALPMYRR